MAAAKQAVGRCGLVLLGLVAVCLVVRTEAVDEFEDKCCLQCPNHHGSRLDCLEVEVASVSCCRYDEATKQCLSQESCNAGDEFKVWNGNFLRDSTDFPNRPVGYPGAGKKSVEEPLPEEDDPSSDVSADVPKLVSGLSRSSGDDSPLPHAMMEQLGNLAMQLSPSESGDDPKSGTDLDAEKDDEEDPVKSEPVKAVSPVTDRDVGSSNSLGSAEEMMPLWGSKPIKLRSDSPLPSPDQVRIGRDKEDAALKAALSAAAHQGPRDPKALTNAHSSDEKGTGADNVSDSLGYSDDSDGVSSLGSPLSVMDSVDGDHVLGFDDNVPKSVSEYSGDGTMDHGFSSMGVLNQSGRTVGSFLRGPPNAVDDSSDESERVLKEAFSGSGAYGDADGNGLPDGTGNTVVKTKTSAQLDGSVITTTKTLTKKVFVGPAVPASMGDSGMGSKGHHSVSTNYHPDGSITTSHRISPADLAEKATTHKESFSGVLGPQLVHGDSGGKVDTGLALGRASVVGMVWSRHGCKSCKEFIPMVLAAADSGGATPMVVIEGSAPKGGCLSELELSSHMMAFGICPAWRQFKLLAERFAKPQVVPSVVFVEAGTMRVVGSVTGEQLAGGMSTSEVLDVLRKNGCK